MKWLIQKQSSKPETDNDNVFFAQLMQYTKTEI